MADVPLSATRPQPATPVAAARDAALPSPARHRSRSGDEELWWICTRLAGLVALTGFVVAMLVAAAGLGLALLARAAVH